MASVHDNADDPSRSRAAGTRRPLIRTAVILMLGFSLVLTLGAAPAGATGGGHGGHGGHGSVKPGEVPAWNISVASQAPVRECWVAVGTRPLQPGADGSCPKGTLPRVTSDYIWGVTKDSRERSIWWGTSNNSLCSGLFEYGPSIEAAKLNPITKPFTTDDVTCEFDQSYDARQKYPWTGDGQIGDARRGQVFQYDIKTGRTIERTPTDAQAPDFSKIGGIRAAGSHGDIVWLGGLEAAAASGGDVNGVVQLLAYRASDGAYLGSKEYPQYSQVKNFFSHDGQTYVGMGLLDPEAGPNGPVTGDVLKFVGDDRHPFDFETVGKLTNNPTYFDVNEGRLVTSTWPGTDSDEPAGVYVSPLLHGRAQLTSADRYRWKKVWDVGQFLPDPLTAAAAQSHTVATFHGWTYYSFARTIGNSVLFHRTQYPALQSTSLASVVDTYRKTEIPGTIVRMKNLGKRNQVVQLLYGDYRYWNYHQGTGWRRERNLLGQHARYGPAGMGNPHLAYVGWGAAVFRGKLYLGGCDVSKIVRDVFLNPATGIVDEVLGHHVPDATIERLRDLAVPDVSTMGGDTYVFDNAHSPARAVTTNGFNNNDTWGNRGLIPIGSKYLFFGTNGGMNYPASGSRDPIARPGWQLLKMR
jgi:hypothetical protein